MGKKIVLIRMDLTEEQMNFIRVGLDKKFYLLQILEDKKSIPTALLKEVQVLVVYSLTEEELEIYQNVSFVQIYGRGTDKICVSELKKRKIYYRCCEGKLISESIAEYVLLQILYWERNFSVLQNKGFCGKWSWEWRNHFHYRALKQLSVGVIGNGHIGRVVADLLTNLGVKVCFLNIGIRMRERDIKQIERMDYITVHVPLNSSTERIIDMDFFKNMKSDAVFINTSRGKIICENHLAMALKKSIIRGASLDVMEDEPIKEISPLWSLDNMIITPHIAGRTANALLEYAEEIVNNINGEVWKWNQC